IKILANFVCIDRRDEVRNGDSRIARFDAHRQLVAKSLGPAAAHSRHAQMLARQRSDHDIELFQRDDAIRFGGLGDVTCEIEKQQKLSQESNIYFIDYTNNEYSRIVRSGKTDPDYAFAQMMPRTL